MVELLVRDIEYYYYKMALIECKINLIADFIIKNGKHQLLDCY